MKYLVASLVFALAACSGGSNAHTAATTAASPTAVPTNTIAFPLFVGSHVLAEQPFHARLSGSAAKGAGFSGGAGTYDGHEVVAATQALMPVLVSWLAQLDANPPHGYTAAAEGGTLADVRERARALGFDFGAFESSQNGKRHGVVVLVVDPATLDRRAGPMLRALDEYPKLPAMLRAPIDAQAKKELGFTVSELTQPDTPLGAAVGSLGELRDYGGRGVVLVDATKE